MATVYLVCMKSSNLWEKLQFQCATAHKSLIADINIVMCL